MQNEIRIKIRKLRPEIDSDIPLPRYMTDQAAGMDIYAAVTSPLVLAPGQIAMVPTGFAIALPEGFEAQIRPRSGLAARFGVTLVNSPGTIDADYRGEIKVALINLGPAAHTINRSDRIAQMVIQSVWRGCWELADSLEETGRDGGGFGHTGR